MAFIDIEVLGFKIDDSLLFKLLLGGICILILLFAYGFSGFSDWAMKSLVIWSGVTMIIIPLSYAFINEEWALKYIIMIVTGFLIVIIFGILSKISGPDLFISVVQSLVWMTVFSIILDSFKKRLQ